MSDALLRVLNAPTGDDIAVARMWEQYDFDASEWDADLDSETDSDVTVEYDWEAVHDIDVKNCLRQWFTMTTKTGTC